jgi:hypothetical protein
MMNTIRSHSYAFVATPTPPINLPPTNITRMKCFKVSYFGALTIAQFIVITENYLVHNITLVDILDFYKSNNPCYKHVEITTPLKGVPSYIFHIVIYMVTPIISDHYLTFNRFWIIVSVHIQSLTS